MSPRLNEDDLDTIQAKPRKGGVLPFLPRERTVDSLRGWLTIAVHPIEQDWRVASFERSGRDPLDPCSLTMANGRDNKVFRFNHQRDLARMPRNQISSVTDGWLQMPHLSGPEVEDWWQALCQLGKVITEIDERDEARKWIEQAISATAPMQGYSLVPDARHDGLMAIKKQGEFTRPDALALIHAGGNNGGDSYQQRPLRFIDAQTGDQWLRAGELATYLRWVLGIEPLSHATLRARAAEVGVAAKHFEDYRPPHPKLTLYRLTAELTEGL